MLKRCLKFNTSIYLVPKSSHLFYEVLTLYSSSNGEISIIHKILRLKMILWAPITIYYRLDHELVYLSTAKKIFYPRTLCSATKLACYYLSVNCKPMINETGILRGTPRVRLCKWFYFSISANKASDRSFSGFSKKSTGKVSNHHFTVTLFYPILSRFI